MWSYVKILAFAMHKAMKTYFKIPYLATMKLTDIISNANAREIVNNAQNLTDCEIGNCKRNRSCFFHDAMGCICKVVSRVVANPAVINYK